MLQVVRRRFLQEEFVSAVRSFSTTSNLLKNAVNKEAEPRSEPPAKRKYTKKPKPIDLTGALQGTFKLVPHEKEIESFGSETEDTKIPTGRPKKVDKSYVKDLDKNVLTRDVRRAINRSNHKKKSEEEEEEEVIYKNAPKANYHSNSIHARRKRIQMAALSPEEREKLFKSSPKSNKTNWGPIRPSKKPETKSSYKRHSTPPPVPKEPAPAYRAPKTQVASTKHRVPLFKTSFEEQNSRRVLAEIATSKRPLHQAEKLDFANIPKLAHNLDKALFSPGVNFLQDPRTRVFNFPPFLKKIIKYEDFNFDAISTFQRVSKDKTLLNMAMKHGKDYYSSTSSMTSTFTQFYLLLNNYNPTKTSRFNFTPFSGLVNSLPTTLIVQPRSTDKSGKTIYSIESDKSFDNEILLSAMGHCLETLLTTEEKEFERFRLDSEDKISKQEQLQNVYNYASMGKFLMRSQLDCYDERLPGNGTFDLKTRAACSVRYDSANPDIEDNTYQIWRLNGDYESFSKEFQDLIRTGALLKYAFQARIGQMDGIYVAYHNINSFFGFQYFPLQELDEIFYNHDGVEKYKHRTPEDLASLEAKQIDLDRLNDGLPTFVAESQFAMSIDIYQNLLDTITKDLGNKTAFRLVMKSERIKRGTTTRLYVHAVEIDSEQIQELQAFPESFQTSFKENITVDQRNENLAIHRDRLKDFNEKSVQGKIVHTYYVDIDKHVIDGKVSGTRCPYPQRVGADWQANYSIYKLDSSEKANARNTHEYLNKLAVSADALANASDKRGKNGGAGSREEILKVYSNIGQARVKRWEDKDQQEVMYRPKV